MILSSGAEAIIRKENDSVVKDRIAKDYRIKAIDDSFRKFRTRRESKVLEKLHGVIPVPSVRVMDDRKMQIEMDFIEGKKVRDVINKKNYRKLCIIIGEQIARMHGLDIIHGDLTTSNFILSGKKVFFIDFGLSFFSQKIEDKAVDLHLLRQALESKHYDIWEDAFRVVLDAYRKNYPSHKEVFSRLDKVEQRGRNKHK